MRIIYHEHAKIRMRSRRISEDEVRAALEEPTITVPADLDRTRYIKNESSGGTISVVAVIRKISDEHFVVYTVYRERGNHV